MHMECECGEYLTDSMSPSDIVLWAYPDKQWKDIQKIGKTDPVLIPDATFEIWRCPKCERLYIFRYPSNKGSMYEIVDDSIFAGDPSRELWHVFTDVEWDEIIFPNEIDASTIPSSSIKIEIYGDYTRLLLRDSTTKKTLEYRFVPSPTRPKPLIMNPLEDE